MLYHQIIDAYAADLPALIFHDQVTTMGELRQRVTVWAAFLQKQGLKKGEKIGLFSRNCSEFVVAYMAVIKAGGVVVPFNFQLAAPEVAYIVKDASMRMLITASKLDLAAALAEENYTTELKQFVFADLDAGDASAYVDVPMTEDDNCTIIYTSGTTGRPKGAMLSHRNLVFNAYDFSCVADMREGDKSLCVLPMYHCFGWTVSVTAALYKGCCVVIQETYSLQSALNIIQKYQINQFAGVPTMFQMFENGAKPEELKSMRFMISGGASLPFQLAKNFHRKFHMAPQEGYGLSEASPVVTMNPTHKVKIGSIGPSLPGVKVEIRDENNQQVATGVVGELCCQGPNVMIGYLNKPEATAEAIRDGWLHTGDLAYRDAEGYVFLVDRLKDMIIAAGENIYPREIEELLYKHPAIREVAVVGVPDKLRGQAVAAYVVVKDGMTASKPELRRFLKGKLANYKLPKYFVFLTELPKNNTGKILKTALRERGIEDVVNRVSNPKGDLDPKQRNMTLN